MQRRVSGQPIFGSMDLGYRLRSFPAKALCGLEMQTPSKLPGPGVGLARMVPEGCVTSGAAGGVAPSRTTRALHLPLYGWWRGGNTTPTRGRSDRRRGFQDPPSVLLSPVI